jgi:hypothetical protein
MSKLDLLLARIKDLPPERQEWIAVEIEFLLDHDYGETALTDEQWAEVEVELASEDAEITPHEQVVREMRAKYGE